jgi:3-isopropylmalate dehydrogenase
MKMKRVEIALIPGDGSGPEMMGPACRVATKAAKLDGLELVFVETPMGWATYPEHGTTMPEESLATALRLKYIFLGGVGDPKHDKTIGLERPDLKPEAKVLIALRGGLGTLLNFRPMVYRSEFAHLAGVRPERIPSEGVNQQWVRFLLEGSYFGTRDLASLYTRKSGQGIHHIGLREKGQRVYGEEDIVSELAYYSRKMLEVYFRAIFAHARSLDLPVIVIHKANMLTRYDFFLKVAMRIAKEFSDVSCSDLLVDAANALLFTPAKLHGVLACGNLQGDILSDGAAAAFGSMGMMHSSSINPVTGAAIFESGAGTAPTLAGTDRANPLGRILTAAMMLRHLGAPTGAQRIEDAVYSVLRNGWRTDDLFTEGRDLSTKRLGTLEMGDLILSCLAS